MPNYLSANAVALWVDVNVDGRVSFYLDVIRINYRYILLIRRNCQLYCISSWCIPPTVHARLTGTIHICADSCGFINFKLFLEEDTL